jgi:hypothetical protein
MARVWAVKSLYMPNSLPIWSTTVPGIIWWLPWLCVCAVVHAHSMACCWACTQAVWAACVCVWDLCSWVDQLGWFLVISSQILFFC